MTIHDDAAELAVIGSAIINSSPSLVADLLHLVRPGDFYRPTHAALFAAIEERFLAGDGIDPTVIRSSVGGRSHQALADALATYGSAQAALAHARRVADLAAVRDILGVAATITSSVAEDGITDPALLLDAMQTGMAAVTVPNDPRPPEGLWSAADLLAADFPEPPWVAPGFLRETWRLLFVGAEGGGKSTLLRQIVAAVALGVHPFTLEDIEPKPALIVDVENPESVIRDGLARIPAQIRVERSDLLAENLLILSRPGGIDIRNRRDRDLLHRAFTRVRPKVASIGPLYKLYRQERGEPDETAAVAAQNVLDELRVTYGCAMVLETHAPKGSGSIRDLIPFGSSAWMRWPELGWKLMPCTPQGDPRDPNKGGTSVQIDRFRGDRVNVIVPERLDRAATSSSWPWLPYWPHGKPRSVAA